MGYKWFVCAMDDGFAPISKSAFEIQMFGENLFSRHFIAFMQISHKYLHTLCSDFYLDPERVRVESGQVRDEG